MSDENCHKCNYYRGRPNTFDHGKLIFICSRCKAVGKPIDRSIENAEQRMGA
jgi:hypothetical protein